MVPFYRFFLRLVCAAGVLLSCSSPEQTVAGVGSGGEAATITGTVVDPSGSPVGGMLVSAFPSEFNPYRPDDSATGDVDTTDQDGTFGLTVDLDAGKYILHGQTDDRMHAFLIREVGAENGEITAYGTGTVTGTLPPGTGSGFDVYIPGTRYTASADTGDSICLRGLPAGNISIYRHDPGGSDHEAPVYENLQIEEGDELHLDLSLISRIQSSRAGDTISLSAGDYYLNGPITGVEFSSGNPVVVRSSVPNGARIIAGRGLHLHGCTGLVFEGLEIAGTNLSGDLVHIADNSRDVTLRGCHIHSAGPDVHCVRVVHSAYVSIDSCVFRGDGPVGSGQQLGTIAFDHTDTSTISECFFVGTGANYHVRTPGSHSIVIENSVFSEHSGDEPAIILGGYAEPHVNSPAAQTIIVRNNIILRSSSGAFRVEEVKGCFIANNLIYDCSGARGILFGYVGPTDLYGIDDIWLVNNIISNPSVPMPDSLMVREGTQERPVLDYNLYYNGGAPIPSVGAWYPDEANGAVVGDPALPVASGDGYEDILNSARPDAAGIWTDAGTNEVLNEPLPGVVGDINGKLRPFSGVDIGPFEF